nr:BamA/TamA family outer membrane protein [Verrucomicrobiota bacterium]
GLRFDVSRDVVARLALGTFIELKTVTVTPEGIDETEIGPLDYLLTSVGLTQVWDRRDHPVNPTRGMILTASEDLSTIDGEQAFSRLTMRFSSYHPVGKNCLLALGARAGLILPVIEQIPIDVRFFSGGATTVRSFAERELGPKDKSGFPLGGEFFTVWNAEFLFPLVNALQGAVFVDAGNLTREGGDPLADMRYAVGLGLRYKLPIGPLRVDYGFNPNRRPDEKIGAFHFSFGFAF